MQSTSIKQTTNAALLPLVRKAQADAKSESRFGGEGKRAKKEGRLLREIAAPFRKTPKMIVFDKDGTLGDDKASLKGWADGMTSHLRAELLLLGRSPSEIESSVASFHDAIGWDSTNDRCRPSAPLAAGTWEEQIETVGHIFGSMGVEGADAKASRWHVDLGNLHGADAPLIDDLEGMMEECRRRGMKVAICTSDDRAPTNAAIASWGLEDVVDYSICGNEVKYGKPHAEPLCVLCRRANVHPSECVVVGDTTSDTGMAACAGAGLCVGVLSGSGKAEQLRKTGADVILPDVGCIPVALDAIWPDLLSQKGAACGVSSEVAEVCMEVKVQA